MVVAVDAPLAAHGFKNIRTSVAVRVFHPRDFRSLRGPEPAVAEGNAERLMQPVRPAVPNRRGVGGIGHHPDFAAPRGHGELAVGHEFQAGHFNRRIRRRGHGGHGVELALGLDRFGLLGEGRGGEGGEEDR